jgi:hypothetical protein
VRELSPGMCVMRTACFVAGAFVCAKRKTMSRFNYFWLSFQSRRTCCCGFTCLCLGRDVKVNVGRILPLFIRISLSLTRCVSSQVRRVCGCFFSLSLLVFCCVFASFWPFNVSLTFREALLRTSGDQRRELGAGAAEKR